MNINNKKGVIILTSTGLSEESVRQAANRYFSLLPGKSVAIITTAADGKENNKYSKLAELQFEELGFDVVDFIDFELNPKIKLNDYNVIYVCGGNTFRLLKYARKVNFKKNVEELLEKGGIYVGVSAGSIILGPTIKVAAKIDPDANYIEIEDLTGLNILNFEIHPHYKPKEEREVLVYENNSPFKMIRLTDNQALIISEAGEELIY